MQKKSLQIIYCLTWRQCKNKFTAGLMCLTLWSHFARRIYYVITSHAKMSPLTHFLSFHAKLYSITLLWQIAVDADIEPEKEGNEIRRKNDLSWRQYVCMDYTCSCNGHGGWDILKEYDPPVSRGQYSLHQQCLVFMVRHGCLMRVCSNISSWPNT